MVLGLFVRRKGNRNAKKGVDIKRWGVELSKPTLEVEKEIDSSSK
jgi:hypothetical protein